MLSGLWRDLLHAARALARARGFSVVCVISLGIGMAPVIAIPYLSRAVHVPPAGLDTATLVELTTAARGPHERGDKWSYPDVADLAAAQTGVTLIPWTGGQSEVALAGAGGEKERASTLFVPARYFSTLGVALARGAGFDAAMDDPLRSQPVVILGDSLWRDRLGADPEIVGKTLTVNGAPHVIVGVAPERFTGHLAFQGGQLFMPLEQYPDLRHAPDDQHPDLRGDRSLQWLHVHGRLAPGVTIAQANAAVGAVTSRLAAAYPSTNEFHAGVVEAYEPSGALFRSQFALIQLVGFTLTGAVLLVVCLNLSGMMQVRSAMRERELSIRRAIGASRARLARYLFCEAFVLALAGGTLASVVLVNVPSLVFWLNGSPMPPEIEQAARVDLSVLVSCFGICILTSVVFGFLPAVRFSRPAIISSLKDEAGVGGVRAGRVHRVTAALQVAIAVPLLVMSGMSIDRVRATATSDLGFAADLLYAAPLNLNGLSVADGNFQIRRLSDLLARSPGVAAVTVADGLPLDFRYRNAMVSLQPNPNGAPRFIEAHVTRVGDRYFDTLRIPVSRGRAFTADDGPGREPVTIITQPLAEKLMPAGDVLGKRLLFGADPKTQQALTVVGVAADFPTSQMSTVREQLLLPLAQHPGVRFDAVPVVDDRETGPNVMLIARGAAGEPPRKLEDALQNVVRQLNPEFQPAAIVTGAWLRRNSMNDFLTQSIVAGSAGGVILLLAALGVYGVIGLMVASRTREIALRAVLGASRARLLGMVVVDVIKLSLPGIAIGLVLTAALNRLNAENMGIALSSAEPLSYVAGAVIALFVAILAALAPARRAASVAPMTAIRSS